MRVPQQRFQQEADQVSARRVAVWVVPATVISILGGVVAWLLTNAFLGELHGDPQSIDDNRRGAPASVSHIDNLSFEEVPSPAERNRLQDEHLQSYGWVDRRAEIIHIPIDRAMEIYMARSQGKGGQGTGGLPSPPNNRSIAEEDGTP